MSVADVYIAESAVRALKKSGAPDGVYSAQCAEGTGGANTAEARRTRTLSREFRLRQAGPSARFADLYATRREAVLLARGAHYAEVAAANFPASACAKVRAEREALMACDRYFGPDEPDAEMMHRCVVGQYAPASGGVYSTSCSDGAAKGQAEDARVAGLAAQYAGARLPVKLQTRRNFNASLFAIATARGCSYEEEQFLMFPKMAGAMRGLTTGAYAASVGGATAAGGISTGKSSKMAALAVRLKGANASAIWPNSEIRKAIVRARKPWESAGVKSYAYMSEAAVKYGMEAQAKPFVAEKYEGWSAGWSAKSKLY